MNRWKSKLFSLLSIVLLAGCVAVTTTPPEEGVTGKATLEVPASATVWTEKMIYGNARWSGDVLITQPVVVVKTGRLTIDPGTRVFFDIPYDPDVSPPPPWILVTGKIKVEGRQDNPVLFTAVQARHHKDEDMISVQDAKQARIRNARFERGGWGLHIHDTQAEVTECEFIGNYGGARFRADEIEFVGNRFISNRIGIRCLGSHGIRLERNSFRNNLTGIFFREGVREPLIASNNFDNLEYDVKMGEGQIDDVVADNNWWRSHNEGRLPDTLYDGTDSEGVGRVQIKLAHPKPFPENAR